MVIADLKSAELPKLFKKEGFHQAFTTYIVSVVLGIFLVLLGTLCLGLVPLNAAYVIHKKMFTTEAKTRLAIVGGTMWQKRVKFSGRSSSKLLMSCEKRLIIRPTGFVA